MVLPSHSFGSNMDVTALHVRSVRLPVPLSPAAKIPLRQVIARTLLFPNIQAAKAEGERDSLGEAKTTLG